ncbi:hypothetical protein BDV25DRAFT_143783 [Aspergillus avenaceus]|uniref:Heterokaryon incompatibility domain-containing protein n=1 Tax=Aspergillus avenaceus TaxID=36643 RepID=A0A5N6TJ70_ASPAV|nr:hypothetical protein BDV25DRAFT_143783 [Aspergillus avenaceus]
MSAIYSSCRSVIAIISLDDLKGDMTQVISWIEARQRKESSWKCFLKKTFLVTEALRNMTSLLEAKEFSADFAFSTYWTRMWTYQEYQLALSDPVCICGNTEVRGTHAAYTLDLICEKRKPLNILQQLILKMRRNTADKLAEVDRRFTELEARSEMKIRGDGIPVDIRRFDQNNRNMTSLLNMTSQRRCKDPKDKIYALYGLVPGLPEIHPVDYNKSLNQIVLETAKFLIETGNEGLVILEWFCVRENRFQDDSLPSWVPDLSTAPSVEERVRMEDFALSKELCWTNNSRYYIAMEDPLTLRVSARPIGICKVTFRFKSDPHDAIRQILDVAAKGSDPQSIWNDVWRRAGISYSLLHACFVYTGVFHSSVKFSRMRFLRISRLLLEAELAGVDAVSEERVMELQHYLAEWLPNLAGKTVFVLQNGTAGFSGFGLGEDEIEDGEQVMTDVHRLKCPLVLRPDHSRGESGRKYYKVVGLAYVDGVCQSDSREDSPYLTHVCGLPSGEFFVC